jgi:thioredoxin-related protein
MCTILIWLFFVQSLHEKKMADNEKKFEIRLDQQKSEITAQVTHMWLLFNDKRSYYIYMHKDHTFNYKYAACKLHCHLYVHGSSNCH